MVTTEVFNQLIVLEASGGVYTLPQACLDEIECTDVHQQFSVSSAKSPLSACACHRQPHHTM
ncbi:hypothetical protein [Vibrio parahaemolyticus]|uniref:hypothetical protein n=1 Tax=Vibrio parahaemolyticus TaxID=670 RepID=UPI000AF4B67A|nr:hypothetical protein [Vibrio parahaemolyticus]EIV8664340.1 hypothetical protein [Vibrio parahaemolyticus]MBE4244539.1 hypothetical protein [Vibrio parahaemolyticus]